MRGRQTTMAEPKHRAPGVRAFEQNPLPHLLAWLDRPAADGVYPLDEAATSVVVADPRLARELMAGTGDRLTARSAVFGAIPGWISGSARSHALTGPLGRYFDGVWRRIGDEEIRAALDTVVGTGAAWPTAGVLLYWRLFIDALVPGLPDRTLRRAQRAILLAERLDMNNADRRWIRLRRRLWSSAAMAGLAGLSAARRADQAMARGDEPTEPEDDDPSRADELGRLLRAHFASDDDVAVAVFALFGAVCRASSTVLSWTILLDAGWRLDAAAPAVLAYRPTAPGADRTREALRLWPVTWLIEREVREAIALGRHQIEPGGLAYVSPLLLHRDPRTWHAPNAYRPDRWTAPPDRYSEAYLPFGTGPTACVGARFVLSTPPRILGALDAAGPLSVQVHGAAPRLTAICSPPKFTISG